MGIKGCAALCARFLDEPMCGHCREATSSPFGRTMASYMASVTRMSRTTATSHGERGTVRQKHQNKTWKYMRVKPSKLGFTWAMFRIKQVAGEARFDEANGIANAKDAANAAWSKTLKSRR